MNNHENIDTPFLPGLEPEEKEIVNDNKKEEKRVISSDEPTCPLCDLYGGICPRHRKK